MSATGKSLALFRAAAERLSDLCFAPTPCARRFPIRMLLGGALLFHYARFAPYMQDLFGPGGIGGSETVKRWPDFPTAGEDLFAPFRLLDTLSDPRAVTILYAALLAASLCFLAGFWTRTSGTVAIALHMVFSAHQPELTGGWVKMFHVFALYIVLSDPGAGYSIDAWLSRRKRADTSGLHAANDSVLSSPWAFRLLQLHVICMYLVAGWPRLERRGWLDGETLFHAVADVRYGRLLLDWYALEPLLRAACYAVMVLEPLATVLLLVPATRRWCTIALIGMHLGIEATTDVGMWQFTMVAGLVAFLPDAWIRTCLDRNRRARGAAAPSA